jgi:hypothetical protein
MSVYCPEKQNFAVRPDDKRLNPKPRRIQFGTIYWETRSYGLTGKSAILPDGRSLHAQVHDQSYNPEGIPVGYQWIVEVRQHEMYRTHRYIQHPEPLHPEPTITLPMPLKHAQHPQKPFTVNGVTMIFGRAKSLYLAKQMVERAAALIGFHPPKLAPRKKP